VIIYNQEKSKSKDR